MENDMKFLSQALFAGLSVVALSATGASAAVVCNDDGDCWRTKEKYDYKPEFGVKIYGDDWKWEEKESSKYRWRDSQEGRGYWRKGVWIGF